MRDRRLSVRAGDRAFHVYVRTYAHAVVPVVLTPNDLLQISANLGVAVADLTPKHLREVLVERAHENTPTIGVCCGGGNFPTEPTLELSDDWETADEDRVDAPLGDVLRELPDEEVDRAGR